MDNGLISQEEQDLVEKQILILWSRSVQNEGQRCTFHTLASCLYVNNTLPTQTETLKKYFSLTQNPNTGTAMPEGQGGKFDCTRRTDFYAIFESGTAPAPDDDYQAVVVSPKEVTMHNMTDAQKVQFADFVATGLTHKQALARIA